MENLDPYEKLVLENIKKIVIDSSDLKIYFMLDDVFKNSTESTGNRLDKQIIRSSLERLVTKNILTYIDKLTYFYQLTELGEYIYNNGMPDKQIIDMVKEHEMGIDNIIISGLTQQDISAAIGRLKKNKIIKIVKKDGTSILSVVDKEAYIDNIEKMVKEIKDGLFINKDVNNSCLNDLILYGFIKKVSKTERSYCLTDVGCDMIEKLQFKDNSKISDAPEITIVRERVTPDNIVTWTGNTKVRPYDVSLKGEKILPGMHHPYMQWINKVRNALVSIGFKEYHTPIIDSEFWNCDVLFMPQQHPARDIHDIFYIDTDKKDVINEELIERVKSIHHNGVGIDSIGWGDLFSKDKSKQLILRSQTTATSAHFLSLKPEPPFKIFSIDKNFRPDAIDNRHNIEFYQCEGIIGSYELGFRDLLGFMKKLAKIMGIDDVWFKPSYFPFTEPSVEGYIHHKKLGWIEALPGGIIRPEIRKAFDIDYQILAWGIGIDRLAMTSMNIDDIRNLHSTNIYDIYKVW